MPKTGFKKVMSSVDLLVVAFGAMIGWGWVVSTGSWIQSAGVLGTVIGFVIGGVMIFFVGMTYAELTPAMPKAGGEHFFCYKAFGKTGSFICTWFLILSYLGVVCFEAVSLPAIVQYIFPSFNKWRMYSVAGSDVYATGIIAAAVFNLLILFLNVIGIKAASIFQTVLTVTIAVVGILLVAASVVNGSPEYLQEHLLIKEGYASFKSIIAVAVVAPFFLFGFDVIPQVAEEINIPLKKIAGILLLSIVCAVTFYSMIVLAVGSAMTDMEIGEAMKGAGLVTASAMEKVFHSSLMAKVLIAGGLCGIITSWNSFLIGGSRAIYAMAEAKMIPHVFAKLHPRYKTPVNALLLIGGLSTAAPFLGRTMLVWISSAASFACCVAYFMVAHSFMVLRHKEPGMERPYKVKHFRFVGIMAVAMTTIMVLLFLIPGTGGTLSTQESMIVGGWILTGILFYASSKKKYRDEFGKVEPGMTVDKALIYLASCTINDIEADFEKTGPLDLEKLYEAAAFHHMIPVVYFALDDAGIKDDAFEGAMFEIIYKSGLFDKELEILTEELESAAIWHMPLKGMVLKQYYPAPEMRDMCDIDILTDPACAHKVRAIMEKHGYTTMSFGRGHQDDYQKRPAYNIEMHRMLFDPTLCTLHEYYSDIRRKLVRDPGKEHAYHFTHEDFYVYMIAHLYKHYYWEGARLGALLDVYVFLKEWSSAVNWEFIRSELKKAGIMSFEERIRSLALKVFAPDGQEEMSAKEYRILSRLGGSGDFGGIDYIFRRMFVPLDVVQVSYPFFYENKFLLPFLPLYRTIKRWKNVKYEVKRLLGVSV